MSKHTDAPRYPQQPWEPHKPERHEFNLIKAGKGKVIYRDLDGNGDYDRDLQIEDMFEDGERPPLPEQRYWEKLSLQDILDLAPPGTKPCDIILGIDFPRDYSYTDLTFTAYKRDLEAEEAEYQKALSQYKKDKEEYDKALPEYEKELEEFEKWKKNKQIQKLQDELERLKNG